jgi:hypothetical protein
MQGPCTWDLILYNHHLAILHNFTFELALVNYEETVKHRGGEGGLELQLTHEHTSCSLPTQPQILGLFP